MTDKLPPQLLALFAPRPPLRFLPAPDYPPEERKTAHIAGVAQFLPALKEYKATDDYEPGESWLQRRDRKILEHEAEVQTRLKEGPKKFNPNDDPNIRGDAFKTLIVARLSYEANEEDLQREFARFGEIDRIRIIKDTHAHEKGNKKRKPHRGYAFVVFQREKDMRVEITALKLAYVSPKPPLPQDRSKAALDGCDNIRIKDRRIKVDVERGRTVKGWKPRRLGGGLGGRGYTRTMPSQPMGRGGFGGGFRGGFRGGFEGRGRGGFRGGRGGFQDRGFGGGGYGQRGGDRNFGGEQNGFGGPPPNAPGGPGYGRGGFRGRDDRREFTGGRGGYDSRDGGRSYEDRNGGGGGGYGQRNARQTGSNMEPIRPRENGGYRDRDNNRDDRDQRDRRDFDRPRDDDSRKRGFEGSYDESRKLRRY